MIFYLPRIVGSDTRKEGDTWKLSAEIKLFKQRSRNYTQLGLTHRDVILSQRGDTITVDELGHFSYLKIHLLYSIKAKTYKNKQFQS